MEVVFKGKPASVRLIGVDTPETVHPSEPVECFGRAASAFTRARLEGKKVRLEFDIERFDKYGRVLAYVWTGTQLFNESLVARGYGQVSTYPPNLKYLRRFLVAERRARKNNRGLWGTCEGGGEEAGSRPGDGGSGRCDPSYKGACIPPYPPDLDCDDVSRQRFRVVRSDPHGFDGDADRIACES